MDLQKLDWAFEYAARSSQHGGLLVARHGYLVYEKYYGKGNREAIPTMASVGKAFTSIACGIMLKEKHDQIPDGLDTKVFTEKYLPEAFPLDDPRKADITLGHLLTMAAGIHGEGTNPGFVNFEPSVRLEPVPRACSTLGQDLMRITHAAVVQAGRRAIRTPRNRRTWRRSCCATWSAWRCSSTSMRSWPSRWVGDSGVMGPIAARTHYLTRPAAATSQFVPRMPCALATCFLHKGKWDKQQLVPADYVEAAASLRHIRNTLRSA